MIEKGTSNGAYLAKGTIGNVGTPGSAIVHFQLVVVPAEHSVSGMVHVTQASEGVSYTGHVTGKIYVAGLGKITQVVGLTGHIRPDQGTVPIEIPFQATMGIDDSWRGTGGFSYASTHVEDAPVKSS